MDNLELVAFILFIGNTGDAGAAVIAINVIQKNDQAGHTYRR